MDNQNIPTITQAQISDQLALHYFGMQRKWAAAFWSSPGMAKTAQHAAFAQDAADRLQDPNFLFFVIRSVHYDPIDVRGIPYTVQAHDRDGCVTQWAPADFVDVITRPGTNGLVFMDEFMQGTGATRQALAPIIHDREIAGLRLSDGIQVSLASNLSTDRAGSGRMETNIRNRVIHYQVEPDFQSWKAYALGAGIAPIVIAYLAYQTEALHQFDPQSNDYAYATLRSWEMVSDIVQADAPEHMTHTAIHGAVGSGHAAAFFGFLQTWRDRNDPDSVIANPDRFDPPNDNPAALHAECISLAIRIGSDGEHFAPIMSYVQRMPADFCQMFLRDATTRDPLLMETKTFTDWCLAHKDQLRDFQGSDL